MSGTAIRLLVAAVVAWASPASSSISDSAVKLHWSPSENLGHIDLGLISSARRTIDMAAYVLTEYAVVAVLRERAEAADAGVHVRFPLDVRELEELLLHNSGHPLCGAADHPNIEIKVKPPGVLMHLKAFAIDGDVMQFGSANFSPSGLKRQDDELAIVRDRQTTHRFEKTFEALWSRSSNTSWRGE